MRLFTKCVLQNRSWQQMVCLRYVSSVCQRNSPLLNKKSFYQKHSFTPAAHQLHSDHRGCTTVADILEHWTNRLTQQGIPEPQTSADLIVAHALGKKMIHEVNTRSPVDDVTVGKIERLCEKRLQSCPVQYIIGEWDFHDMTLDMRPPVLIPRTETEELADYILADQTNSDRQMLLDIGCGSGALALFLLKQIQQAQCVAVDISEAACELTQQNASKHSLQDRLQVVHGSILDGDILEMIEQKGPYDIIVSNPPYIPTADMARLHRQVHGYEDHGALHGGSDGMDMIRYILSATQRLLKPNTGSLWLEVDLSHPAKIEKLVATQHSRVLQYVKTLQDYTRRDRFCVIRIYNYPSPG